MGSKNTDRQIVIDIDNSTPTLLQVLELAKSHAPNVSDIEALRKYYDDNIQIVKKTNSPELWYRVRTAAQLISLIGHVQSDYFKNLYVMN